MSIDSMKRRLTQMAQQRASAMDNAYNQADSSRGQFGGLINEIMSRGRGMTDAPALTAQDLFGEQLTRVEDSARQNANALKQAISRSMMSGGGDVSGAAGTQLLNIGQNTNQAIGQSNLDFTQLAERINRQNQAQGLGLLSQGLQGTQNLASFDQALFNALQNRQDLQNQARRQRRSDFLGGLLNIGTTLGSSAIMACWVAMELYGEDAPKTQRIRAWLYGNKGEDNLAGKFLDYYKVVGEEWAEKIKDNVVLRGQAKALFDDLYRMATEE